MNREEILYLAPYILSLLFSLGIFVYTWQHQRVRGAQFFAWAIGGQTLSIFGFIMEMVTYDLGIKIIWDKFQWLTQTLFIVAYFAFVIQYTNHKLRFPKASWGIIIAIPLILSALVITDDAHHLIYMNPRLDISQPFAELLYEFSIVIYIYAAFIYTILFYGIGLLVKRVFQSQSAYRVQFALIALGFFIPVALTVFGLFGIKIAPERDSSPYTYALGNFIVALGLFRYRLFDIIPIVRELVFENMNDPVIVLDSQNRIVDANPAALSLINKKNPEVLGRSFSDTFGRFKNIAALFEGLQNEGKEISIAAQDDELFFDFNISPVNNENRALIGYIIVARDITRQKTLETSYRILSSELDKRVKERTEELRRSEEKFFKAFQASPDAIVLANFKTGQLVEVNEGFEKIFGYTREEILGHTSLELGLYATPSDREKFITSLQTHGHIQNDEYKIKTKNGEQRHMQVSAELIDINGKQHIVVINRDITEQKHAEDALLQELILNARMANELQLAYDNTLEGWSRAMDLRDKETEGHTQRVTELTLKLAEEFSFNEEDLVHIKRGSLLHDIGKMGIPDSILLKNGSLSDEEWVIMRRHPVYAYEMLSRIHYLQPALDIPYCHHEKWNGSGYPRGLKEEEIPLSARIFAAADVWDALSSDRPYRKAWSREQVIDYLKTESGRHFDPHVVNVFLTLVEKGRI